MSNRIVCIVHKACLDGWAAAWAFEQFRDKTTEVIYHTVDYDDPTPEVRSGDIVYILDYSLKPDILVKMSNVVEKIIMLDHHATAILELEKAFNLPIERSVDRYGKDRLRFHTKSLPGLGNVELDLDTYQSGAGLTWRYFTEHQPPTIIKMVEDYDLWRFAIPGSAEYARYMFSLPYCFEAYTLAAEHTPLDAILFAGAAMKRDDTRKIEWLMQNALRFIDLATIMHDLDLDPGTDLHMHKVPVVNVPKYMVSETLNTVAKDYPFAIGYYDSPTRRVFRINSNKQTGVNIRWLAETLGGGGHDNSASFKVPRNHPLAKI